MDKPATEYERTDVEAVLDLKPSGGRRLRRYALAVLAAAILLAGGYALYGGRSGGGAPRYVTAPVERADLTVIVSATGTVEPTTKVDVSSELSGIIRNVLVDYNSTVRIGDVLAELDTDKLRATVDSSRARLVAARSQVGQASATVVETRLALERKMALVSSSAGSQQDLDAAKAAYDRAVAAQAGAAADVGVAEAQLKLDETNLAKARILSPINGVVLARNVDPGQTVATSFQAPVLFTIAEDLKEMEVQVDVDEADVGTVREGQAASFSVDAYPGRSFPAQIRELRFGSEVVQGVVTYKAVLATDNADLLLRPGMTATAEIVVAQIDDALAVPNAALRFAPAVEDEAGSDESWLSRLLPRPPRFRQSSPQAAEGDAQQVWVLRNGAPVAVSVTVGASDGRRTEVRSGTLEIGQAVIVDTVTAGG